MPAPEVNPDLLADAPDEGSDFGTVTRGNHATHGDAFSGGNHHIDKSCVVRQNIYCAKALEASAYTVRESTYGDSEDPQFDPEHLYTSPGTLAAGFVKNDGDGNFMFGQPGDGSGGGVTALTQLDDVTLTSPAGREYLCFDSSIPMWVNQVIAIDDLGDVIITSPANGQILEFDGSAWINKTFTLSVDLGDLDDVNVPAPATGSHLEFNGTIWFAAVPSSGGASELNDLSDVALTSPASGEFLRNNGAGQFVNVQIVEADISDLQSYALAVHSHVEADITDLQAYLLDITSESLGDLSDVSAASPNTGDHLEWSGSSWVPAAPGHSAPGASALNDLSDVTITAADSGDFLRYNGSAWVDTIIADSDVPNDLTLERIELVASSILDFEDSSNRVHFRIARTTGFSPSGNIRIQTGVGPGTAPQPAILVEGTETNIGLQFETKGTGTFRFKPSGGDPAAGLLGVDSSGNLLFAQSAAASALNDLSDVILSGVVDNNVLQFDGSDWVNRSDVELSSTSAYYLGDAATDGTWRFVRNGTDLQVELRESGTYNPKGSFTP